MSNVSFALFDSPLGACAVTWSADDIVGLQLPESDEAKARARIAHRYPGATEEAPSAEISEIIEQVGDLLRGKPVDLTGINLDMRAVPDFDRRVYAIARTIPPGATMTYGEIAARLGDRAAAREVGQALGRNPFPVVVPCHRVVAAHGRLGGFSARGGATTKLRLLAIEQGNPGGGAMVAGGQGVLL
jgi:methylated-DNA-[protein]-cysteine S-methyltransferase